MSIPALPTRRIGTEDVTAIGYGAMGIAAFYGSVDSDEERLKVIMLSYTRCQYYFPYWQCAFLLKSLNAELT